MLPTPRAPWKVLFEVLSRPGVWLRIGIVVAATTLLYLLMTGWNPAFSYRIRIAPLRDMVARTAFKVVDSDATAAARTQARDNFANFYINKPRPLDELRQALLDDMFEVKQKSYAEQKGDNLWTRFLAIDPETNQPNAANDNQKAFQKFKDALLKDEKLTAARSSIENAFINISRYGLINILEHELTDGSMQEIQVYQGDIEDAIQVNVSQVRIAEVLDSLKKKLLQEFSKNAEIISDPVVVAERVFNWLKPRLPKTLTWDQENSKRGRRIAASLVECRFKEYQPGDPLEKTNYQGIDEPRIRALVPLDQADIDLLTAEHEAHVQDLSIRHKLARTAAFFGLFAAVSAMVCGYLYCREPEVLNDLSRFAALVSLFTLALTLSWVVSANPEWRASIIPIMILAMTVAIAFGVELAIFLSALAILIYAVLHGYGMGEFVILSTASTTAALLCRPIRSRTKLVYVGIVVAAVVFPTVVGVQYLSGQPLARELWIEAGWYGLGAGMAGLIMTALLPFLEMGFGIQTDINLLEFGDANHPLLKELVQRAPGTYNHSINVASISEAAAEAIGANGLLCRVGAYFHDIGKMRKPEYFIENQGGGVNKHDELNPAMSTLVIIAHVKEGVEMGRQHNLPQRIIDMIEQHHGTTLVSYFYHRATRQSEQEGDRSKGVKEIDFRYPGPKPQTREAAVMMLADSVESASRVLREPTPSRIESLVNDIAKQKLDDGQFDECALTLKELHTIQENLIKSLNAMYHARVKYPDQQSA